MATAYKVWIEVEEIEDYGTQWESYKTMDLPYSAAATFDTYQEACEYGRKLTDLSPAALEIGEGNEIVTRAAPQWVWDIVDETLSMDGKSSAFDPELRDQINAALDALVAPNR